LAVWREFGSSNQLAHFLLIVALDDPRRVVALILRPLEAVIILYTHVPFIRVQRFPDHHVIIRDAARLFRVRAVWSLLGMGELLDVHLVGRVVLRHVFSAAV